MESTGPTGRELNLRRITNKAAAFFRTAAARDEANERYLQGFVNADELIGQPTVAVHLEEPFQRVVEGKVRRPEWYAYFPEDYDGTAFPSHFWLKQVSVKEPAEFIMWVFDVNSGFSIIGDNHGAIHPLEGSELDDDTVHPIEMLETAATGQDGTLGYFTSLMATLRVAPFSRTGA